MTLDIGPIVEGWEHKPEELNVRVIEGVDGSSKIQIRIDMGLLQLETNGRPDGTKPHGQGSLLDHYLSLLEEHGSKHNFDLDHRFTLNHRDCELLFHESMQYYYRRISFLTLGMFEKSIKDADHSLSIMDLRREYAESEEDRLSSEQYRGFVLMQRTQAEGKLFIEKKDYERALGAIDRGIEQIEDFFRRNGREDLIEESKEIALLTEWKDEIANEKPLGPLDKLRKELQAAVEKEDFEKAAFLRDRIRDQEEFS